jgi:hypothetical protein
MRQVAERTVEEVDTRDRAPVTHIANPSDNSVALCGTRRPPETPIYKGQLEEQVLPCVVCLDLKWMR